MGFPILVHQPADVRPKEIDQWSVRVRLVVGMHVVDSVDHDPTDWGIFKATNTEDRKDVFDPARGFERAMGQESVIADGDALAEDMDAGQHEKESDPTEAVRDQRQQPEQMNPHDRPEIESVKLQRLDRCWD